MKRPRIDYGVSIFSCFDQILNGTTHGRLVPRHPTMDEADDNDQRARVDRSYYTGRSHYLSRRRKPASKP